MGSELFPDMDPENMTKEELVAYFYEMKGLAAEHKRSEDALRLDEARLEALLKLNDMAMASEEDVITYSLEEAIRLTGSKIGWMGALSPDEKTLIMHCWSADTKKACSLVDRPHMMNVDDGGIWIEPIRQRKPVIMNGYGRSPKKNTPYGHVYVDRFMGIPVYDGTRIVAVAEVGNKEMDYDTSDMRQLCLLMSGVWRIILRKRAEEALADSMAQAELYVDFMGHDINNMNQVAMGFIELALEKLSSKGGLEREDIALLEKPMDTMKNSARLIANVKKLQRLRAGLLDPIRVDLDEVLSEVRDEAIRVKGRQVEIKYDPEPGRYVKANELLKDVFSNIVGNSIRHSSPDMPLWISIDIMTTDSGHRISIEDNGPGIPEMRKNEIFERLSQGKMKALRTGLGLGLVKTLVESYNGRIWVEDRIEGDHTMGCRFVVLLPRAAPSNSGQKDMTRA